MKLQIVSDIHLELAKKCEIPKVGDAISLLGDIGFPGRKEYQDFIGQMSGQYELVLVVAGNHEYYDSNQTYQSTRKLLRELEGEYDNVKVLDNSSFVVDDIRFVGSTLWSRIPDDEGYQIMCLINDYNKITLDDDDLEMDFSIFLNGGEYSSEDHLSDPELQEELEVWREQEKESSGTTIKMKKTIDYHHTNKWHKEAVEFIKD